METIEYKNLEWYIINETDKEKLLFLKDSFSNEQVLKYFTDKNMIDKCCDVRYSKLNSPWFIDSYIKEVLNGPFLSDLDKNDLNIMKTTLKRNGQTKISEDYVRLITKEEVEIIQKANIEILYTEREYGYWTINPYGLIDGKARVFTVYGLVKPGGLGNACVIGTRAVRPVISLKSENLKSEVSLENDELRKAILKFRKRTSH